ncbi:hypothetical protein RCL1_004146 [Eukaryota sp. TZLM3-RCL]
MTDQHISSWTNQPIPKPRKTGLWMSFHIHFVVFICAQVFFYYLQNLSKSTHPWIIYTLFPWLTGILCHFSAAFFNSGIVKGIACHTSAYLCIMTMLIIVNIVTTKFLWVLFPLLSWLFGLLMHIVAVIAPHGVKSGAILVTMSVYGLVLLLFIYYLFPIIYLLIPPMAFLYLTVVSITVLRSQLKSRSQTMSPDFVPHTGHVHPHPHHPGSSPHYHQHIIEQPLVGTVPPVQVSPYGTVEVYQPQYNYA